MMEKELSVTNIEDAKQKVSDITVYGDGDTFALLCKASSKAQGWMKSTKVCNVDNGCIVQVSTQQKNPDGSYSVAEALTYVPDTKIDVESEPRKLVALNNYGSYINRELEINNAQRDTTYEASQYLMMLLEFQKAGHDVHAEINQMLKHVKPDFVNNEA